MIETDLATATSYEILEQELKELLQKNQRQQQQFLVKTQQEEKNNLTGLSSNSLKRASFAGPNRAQSQLFSVSRTVNPLVAAAAPLLTLATRLGEFAGSPDLNKLYEQLCHEVEVFEYKAQSLGYKSQVVIAARYFLCSLVDETIQHSTWGEHSAWQQRNLLTTFQDESNGAERCFFILERCMHDSILYFDLIELSYLCFSFGLEGKHRGTRYGHDELTNLSEALYGIIRAHRGEPCRKLSIVHQSGEAPKRVLRWHLPPVWMTLLLGAMVMSAIYWPYHQHLRQMSQPVEQALKNLSSPT